MEKETEDKIIDAIRHEVTFPKLDKAAQEDEMYHRLGELSLSNLLSPEEVEEVYEHWRRVFGE